MGAACSAALAEGKAKLDANTVFKVSSWVLVHCRHGGQWRCLTRTKCVSCGRSGTVLALLLPALALILVLPREVEVPRVIGRQGVAANRDTCA